MQPILRLRAVAILASLVLAAAGAQALTPANAVLPDPSDTLVSTGSPNGPFSSNKQNEPAVAINPVDPTMLVAGANDNIDMEACNAGPDDDCPFTPGVGVSGVYFSVDSGSSWTQPTYQGLTAGGCTGVVGDADPACVPQQGPIGTLPNYAEHGLVADGDPAVAFGPRPTAGGGFSYANGPRLYYANLTSAVPGAAPFKGFEAIAVSHTDDLQAAAAGSNAAWSAPGDRQQAERRALRRQGAGVGRQRRHQPALRQRVRLLRGLPVGAGQEPAAVRAHLARRRHHLEPEAGHRGRQQPERPAGLRPKRLHGTHRLARRRVRVHLRLRARLARPRADPAGPVVQRRQHLDETTHRRHGVRHLLARRAVDRPLRHGRCRRRPVRPVAGAVGRHRRTVHPRAPTPRTGS